MTLRGTMTEQSIRTELLRTREYIFSSKQGKLLHQTLLETFQKLRAAYILHWTPDESASYFTILVNGQTIISVEIEEEITKKWLMKSIKQRVVDLRHYSINEYKYGLSKINQIRLEVAMDLSNKDIHSRH